MRNVFVMSQDDQEIFLVDVAGLPHLEANYLLKSIKRKYNSENVVGFIPQNNGEWLFT